MRCQTTPSFSPHGAGGSSVAAVRDSNFRSGQPAQARHVAEPSQAHRPQDDNHDDGLVHGHFWAMSSTVR